MPDQLQLRGGTTTEHNSFTGALREVTVDTTKKTLVVHDGASAGGTPLMKESGGTAATTVQLGTGGVERFKITNGEVVFNETSTDTDFRIEGNGEANLFKVDAGNDRIGIGLSSPTVKLDVAGSLRLQSGGATRTLHMGPSSAGIEYNVNGTTFIQGRTDAFPLAFKTQSVERMRIDSSGRVRIGCTAQPSLTVSGAQFDADGKSLRFSMGGGTSGTVNGALTIIGGGNSTNIAASASYGAVINLVNTNSTNGNSNAVLFKNSNELATSSVVGETTSHTNRTGELAFLTSNTAAPAERMRIDSSGNVGIGTTSPDNLLHIESSSNTFLQIEKTGTASKVFLGNSGGEAVLESTGGAVKLKPNGRSNDFVLTTSGKLGIGTSNPVGRLHLHKADSGTIDALMITNSDTTNNGLTIGVNSGEQPFFFNGSNTDMTFGTNNTERLRITSSGNVGIGTSSPDAPLTIHNDSDPEIRFGYNSSQDHRIQWDGSKIFLEADPENGNGSSVIGFKVDGSEAMRIDGSGNIHIGRTDTLQLGANNVTGINLLGAGRILASSQNSQSEFGRQGSNGEVVRFACQGTGNVGSIDVTTSSTSYNTSSDYRLKENVTAISDGITRLKTLKPSRFNFKVNKDKTVDGFLAHEVTAVPEAITGIKDEVATEDNELEGIKKGDPIYQKIDQSKLVPLLVAAVQELIGKVEALEAA